MASPSTVEKKNLGYYRIFERRKTATKFGAKVLLQSRSRLNYRRGGRRSFGHFDSFGDKGDVWIAVFSFPLMAAVQLMCATRFGDRTQIGWRRATILPAMNFVVGVRSFDCRQCF
jgi:hypothetical protein